MKARRNRGEQGPRFAIADLLSKSNAMASLSSPSSTPWTREGTVRTIVA